MIKKRHTDTRSYLRCSIGVRSFTNNGSGVNDPNNPYLILARSRLKKRSYGERVYILTNKRGWKGVLNKIITTH